MPANTGHTGHDRAEQAQMRRASVGLFCALLAPLTVAHYQALAQTDSPQTGSVTQTTPATPGASSVFLPPAAPIASPFLPINPVDLSGVYLPNGGSPQMGVRANSIGSAGGYPTNAGGPQGPAAPPFLLDGAVDVSEGYTTNASGLQGSAGKPDTFTRGRFSLGLHYTSRRFIADAHYSLTGYHYNRFHDLDQLQNRANLSARSELLPNHLFLNVSAFAAPTSLSRLGRLSTNEALVSNINGRNSYGYVAEPVLKLRLGDYAISQTSLNQSAVFFTQPSTSSTDPALPFVAPNNSTSISATEQILSEPYFGRFRWGLTASYADMSQTTQSQQQTEGTIEIAYALDSVITMLATAGYDQFKASVPLTQSLSGPIALAGVRYSYGPAFNLVAGAGVRNGFPTYLGSLHWDATATFKIDGFLTDSIGTPQGNILNNLSTLAASAQGAFYDAQSNYWQTLGQALFPQFATVSPIPTLGLALDNSINHSRRARLTLVHQDERTQYGLSFFGDMRDRLNVGPQTTPLRSWVYGAGLNVTRRMRRNLTGYAGVTYSLASEFGGRDRVLTADAGLTYMLAKNLDCYLTGQYLKRESQDQIITNLPLSDLTAIIGIRRTFGQR